MSAETRYQTTDSPHTPGSEVWDNRTSETGRCANTDPLLDRCNLAREGSGPMHIVPTADSTANTPPIVARMGRLDGCPECVTNTEAPYRVEDRPGGFAAYYGCESCGYFWSTCWEEC